jgi:hypothetical protein
MGQGRPAFGCMLVQDQRTEAGVASDPAWRRRYERAAAQQREAGVPAMRARYGRPFLPYLLEHLLIGLVFGLFGWLAVNWVRGLISFVSVAGIGLLIRVHFVRRYGETERSLEMDAGSPLGRELGRQRAHGRGRSRGTSSSRTP